MQSADDAGSKTTAARPDKEILYVARALIIQGWCQGVYATDKDGKETSPQSNDAKSWCISGALIRAHGFYAPSALKQLICPDGPTAIDWNDTPGRTQEEVIQAFDRAIEKLS